MAWLNGRAGAGVFHMVRPIIAVFVLFTTLYAIPVGAQQSEFKNFNAFKQVVPGVDFFASTLKDVTPFEKPAAEVIARLRALLGNDLPKGAIFICSSMVQKDSVYEPKVLKSGYSWTLTVETSQVSAEQ
jgi:hypothetical protein